MSANHPHSFFCSCDPCWDKKMDANDRYDATPEGQAKITRQRERNQTIQDGRRSDWNLYVNYHDLYGPAAKFPA